MANIEIQAGGVLAGSYLLPVALFLVYKVRQLCYWYLHLSLLAPQQNVFRTCCPPSSPHPLFFFFFVSVSVSFGCSSSSLFIMDWERYGSQLLEMKLSQNAREIAGKRWVLRDADEKPVETPEAMCRRVAWHMAKEEKKYLAEAAGGPTDLEELVTIECVGGHTTEVNEGTRRRLAALMTDEKKKRVSKENDNDDDPDSSSSSADLLAQQHAVLFYNLLASKRFFPNSPTFTGSDTQLGQLAACFVLPLADDLGKDPDGITSTLRNAALVQQTGGGNGFSFSRLREKGSVVASSNGISTGPLGFLKAFDALFRTISQGGTRRGANMAVLRIDHPDIREFISCKKDEGEITNFNISVAVTDEFFEALRDDETFNLRSPKNGRVKCSLPARELWSDLVKYAHRNGEPGVLFIDRANRDNPVPMLYTLESTNPCLSGDTYVTTKEYGPQKLEDLAEKARGAVHLLLNGEFHRTDDRGIFPTGVKPTILIKTDKGPSIRVTEDHRVMKQDENTASWVCARSLCIGDKLLLSESAAKDSCEPFPFVWSEALEVYLSEAFEDAQEQLRSLFSDCGTVVGDYGSREGYLRVGLLGLEKAKETHANLKALGIHSKIERSVHAKKSSPAPYRVVIAKDNLLRFKALVGFPLSDKRVEKLEELIDSYRGPESCRGLPSPPPRPACKDARCAKITHLELSAEPEPVYDACVPSVSSFEANGFVVHNCGEQWLGPYENCCLGSINLFLHLKKDDTGKYFMDWPSLEDTIQLAVRFLDDVVDANNYVPSVPQLHEAAMKCRRIGLGFTGLADVMFALEIRYGDIISEVFAAQLTEFLRYHAMKTSVQLARERGSFPEFENSIFPNFVPPTVPEALSADWGQAKNGRVFGCPELDWDTLGQEVRKGIRNAATTTIAPTGTITAVMDLEGWGCEPSFALSYFRTVRERDDGTTELTYGSPLLREKLQQHPDTKGLSEQEVDAIIDQVKEHGGSVQGLESVPESIRQYMVTSGDVTPTEHVRMQAAIQAFIDNSMSKTCNLPPGATPDDVARCFLLAHQLGCKGITVYVTGSRETVVLQTKAEKERKEKKQQEQGQEKLTKEEEEEEEEDAGQKEDVFLPSAISSEQRDALLVSCDGISDADFVKPRPPMLPGYTFLVDTPHEKKCYTTINEMDGQPFEVFVSAGKAGSDISASTEVHGRLMSLLLRTNSPVPPIVRLKQIQRQLSGIGGSRKKGFGPNAVYSLPDAISKALDDYIRCYVARLSETTSCDIEEEEEATETRTPSPAATRANWRTASLASLHQLTERSSSRTDYCPQCGNATLIRMEGCKDCIDPSCGYSEC